MNQDLSPIVPVVELLLSQGHRVRLPTAGSSMYPTLRQNDIAIFEPAPLSSLAPGDIVLVRISGRTTQSARLRAHRLRRVSWRAGQGWLHTKGDASFGEDGPPTPVENFLGRLCGLERKGRALELPPLLSGRIGDWSARVLPFLTVVLRICRHVTRL